MAKAKKEKVEQVVGININVPGPDIEELLVTIRGTAPLIYHKWSEKAKTEMLEKHLKKIKQARKVRNPKQEYEDSFYKNDKGEIVFPARCIKSAIVGAARSIEGVAMTEIRGALFVRGDERGMIKVDYKKKEMREDTVRVGKGSADLRYRGQLIGWSMTFKIEYNANVFTSQHVINLLETAGFSQGLGEWRPERNGDFGTFTVAG